MKAYIRDLTERAVATFVQAFIGSVVITELNDKSMWLAAIGGGVAAVLSLAKGLIASGVGDKWTASLVGSKE